MNEKKEDSKKNIKEDSKRNINEDSKRNIYEDSKRNINEDSKRNIYEDSERNINEDSKRNITVGREINYEYCLTSLLEHVKEGYCCKKKAEETLNIIEKKFVKDNYTELQIFSMWRNGIQKQFKNNDNGDFCLGKHPSFK